ncbi:hypothetical protein KKF34_10845 [Myxococcota bacterium]|nr:hypothetical protein [Myxococcota bacterium]MBU1382812.1 hypothetical protein [Myxococcota bacterium]MBU1497365.1 hypothetical protein [Myxococcota bacterium]
MLKTISLVVCLIILTISLPAFGRNTNVLEDSVREGASLCKKGDYSKGIDQILDAAMSMRRNDPKSFSRSRWRVLLDKCYIDWAVFENKACNQSLKPAHYENLENIYKKSAVAASKATRHKIRNYSSTCLNSIRTKTLKLCSASEGHISTLKYIAKYLPAGLNVKKYQKDLDKCIDDRWKEVENIIRQSTSMTSLKSLWLLWKVDRTRKLRYINAVNLFMANSMRLCSVDMDYRTGRNLMEKAIKMYQRDFPVDTEFNSLAAKSLQQCGIFRIRMESEADGITGGVSFKYSISGDLYIVPVGNAIKACGALSIKGIPLNHKRCNIIPGIRKAKHFVCFTGRMNRIRRDKSPAIYLKYDSNFARNLISEVIQKSCPGKSAIIIKENLLEQLFNSRLHFTVRGAGGEEKAIRNSVDAGNGRKITFLTKFRVHMK